MQKIPDTTEAPRVTARKDNAPAAVQTANVNVAGLVSICAGGRLIQTTSGQRQHRMETDQRRGCR